MARGIDHIVHAVRDLEAARATYDRLGFTLTPPAGHPFGTCNSLAQFGASFVELLAVEDESRIPAQREGFFSFAAFCRDFLVRHEGIAMLALDSANADADVAAFRRAGIGAGPRFDFSRMARQPDGFEGEVSFSLAFAFDPKLPETGVFTCQNRTPEFFWRRAYQAHANGAREVAGLIMIAPDPADHHIFLEAVTGVRDLRVSSSGISAATKRGSVEILNPAAAEYLIGADPGPADPPRFVAMRIAVAELEATAVLLAARGVPFKRRHETLVVPPSFAHGAAIVFVAG